LEIRLNLNQFSFNLGKYLNELKQTQLKLNSPAKEKHKNGKLLKNKIN